MCYTLIKRKYHTHTYRWVWWVTVTVPVTTLSRKQVQVKCWLQWVVHTLKSSIRRWPYLLSWGLWGIKVYPRITLLLYKLFISYSITWEWKVNADYVSCGGRCCWFLFADFFFNCWLIVLSPLWFICTLNNNLSILVDNKQFFSRSSIFCSLNSCRGSIFTSIDAIIPQRYSNVWAEFPRIHSTNAGKADIRGNYFCLVLLADWIQWVYKSRPYSFKSISQLVNFSFKRLMTTKTKLRWNITQKTQVFFDISYSKPRYGENQAGNRPVISVKWAGVQPTNGIFRFP